MDNKRASEIIKLAESRNTEGNSREAIFARVYLAARKTLKITPFPQQIAAAIALSEHNMVQMQTGEGKTLAAVFAACYEALNGGSVMVLTFNDYLAERDYNWMKPVYDEVGVSVGCITAASPREQRREIYRKSVVYVTAKEAGFDYLRDFVCFEPKSTVFPDSLNFAIVDEADSIMLDEARIPLVIAGDMAVRQDEKIGEVYRKTEDFTGEDYGIDEDSRNVYLTDEGADKSEEIFECGDIYGEDNSALLSKICACLKARVMLKPDKDYIIKDGSIVIIDEMTGRAAPGRVFPGDLQAAVEAKHGLKITSRGRIMGNIALQYFLRLFPKIAGMTGTAINSKDEFDKIYGLPTEIIPTRLPCQRTDNPLELYYDSAEKFKAVFSAIKQAHENNRPVLVGTSGIGESEALAEMLEKSGISCCVLNAKNDSAEAEIIARAGEPGAVTISTNMAGRGVDIKLGGTDCSQKAEAERAGGLLVIAASMGESERITNQLRGRSGRQGDVGESRFMASLDEEIMSRCGLKSLCGKHYPKEKTEGQLTDKVLLKEAERVQRIAEGDAFDERERLMKYTMIGEKHRAMTFEKRTALLEGKYDSDIWQKNSPDLFKEAERKFGAEKLQQKQNIILAALLNEFWCDYLDYTAYLREGIHLTQIAGRNPAEEYNIACEEYYESSAESIPERMERRLSELLECGSLEEYQPPMPGRTYTYLLNDTAEEFRTKPLLLNVFSEEEAPEKPPQSDNTEKKGFFSRLFGKK